MRRLVAASRGVRQSCSSANARRSAACGRAPTAAAKGRFTPFQSTIETYRLPANLQAGNLEEASSDIRATRISDRANVSKAVGIVLPVRTSGVL
jgi:hypothetical protein